MAPTSLLPDDVHVWSARLDEEPPVVAGLAQTLSPDEQERANRFVLPQHRGRFIVARGLLRSILAEYLGVAPRELRFEYGPGGKPTLGASPPGAILSFNLSHSRGLAVLGVSIGRAIGIDVEQVRALRHAAQIAQRIFSERENASLKALDPAAWDEGFFWGWTGKEAYLKALGQGISRPLAGVEVEMRPNEPARLLSIDGDDQEAARWSLARLSPALGYVATIAVEGDGWQLRHMIVGGRQKGQDHAHPRLAPAP